jgi:hypothetical protein
MTHADDIFTRARHCTDVEIVAGVKLYREGAGFRGPCPLCKASAGKTDSGAFQTDKAKSTWRCFSCHSRPGDVVDLEHLLRSGPGETLRDAALRLLREDNISPAERRRRQQEIAAAAKESEERKARSRAFKAEIAITLWREGLPAAGTPVEAWLRSRGISGAVLANALSMVRYHPAAYHSGDPNRPVTAPAMIGLIMTPFGPTGGVHATYLSPDGSAKADLAPARKCWGPQTRLDPDGIARPGGLWLSRPDADGPLVVGEGIETSLSAGCMLGIPCRVVATLDLDNLQGGYLTDGRGRVDLRALEANPLLPAFTWPEPAHKPWGAPVICLDRDMSPVKIRVAGDDDVDDEEWLSADDRATLCAALAAAAWITAGSRWIMFAVPPADMDINDQHQAVLAGQMQPGLRVLPLAQVGANLPEYA